MTGTNTACTTCSLIGWCFRCPCDPKCWHTSNLVIKLGFCLKQRFSEHFQTQSWFIWHAFSGHLREVIICDFIPESNWNGLLCARLDSTKASIRLTLLPQQKRRAFPNIREYLVNKVHITSFITQSTALSTVRVCPHISYNQMQCLNEEQLHWRSHVCQETYLSCVHHILDVGDGERCLSNIGGHHAQPTSFRRRIKHLRGK